MLKLRGASTSERGRDFRSLKNINYDFSMTHAPTPWGFSPIIGGTNFKHEYLSNRVELHDVPYINGKISHVETIKRIIVPEYINLVGQNSH